jgi:flagellar M-ring protein FliF
VTIVDDNGHLLSQADEPNSSEGLTSRQLGIEREIEDYERGKAEKIVSQIVGTSDLRIQVSAAMNFDKIERTTASVDPDKQAVAVEQKNQALPGAQGGGQSNSSTTYDNTRSTESFVAAPGSIKRLTVAVLVADKVAGTAAKPTTQPRTSAEIENIRMLVWSAVGADSTRGDVVTVVSVPFAVPVLAAAEPLPARDMVATIQALQRPVLGALGLALAFVVAFLAIKAFGRSSQSLPELMALPLPNPMSQALPAPTPTRIGIRDRVSTSIEGQPDVAARVVRAWLKEG